LALVQGESGAEVVAEALKATAAVSVVNWAEVLSKVAEVGGDPAALQSALRDTTFLGGVLVVEPLTLEDCAEVARLRPATRALGLSLADRACLALATRLGLPALTTDRDLAAARGEQWNGKCR
jgi:PIN domain nuclease of toxin-antitoxin system